MTPRRIAPINVPMTLKLGRQEIADGILTVYPRQNSTKHPIAGHVYLGAEAHPFRGQIDGLTFDSKHSKARGRPPEIARYIAVGLAYRSILRTAAETMRPARAKAFATARCLDLWQEVRGMKEARDVRRARSNMDKELTGQRTGTFIYGNGTDFVVVLLLPGATLRSAGGVVHMRGPAWVWRSGDVKAHCFEHISASAQVPDAPDYAWN